MIIAVSQMNNWIPRHKTEVYAACVFVQSPETVMEDVKNNIRQLLKGRTTGTFNITFSESPDV